MDVSFCAYLFQNVKTWIFDHLSFVQRSLQLKWTDWGWFEVLSIILIHPLLISRLQFRPISICASGVFSNIFLFQCHSSREVVTLSHTLLGSPQGVPKESLGSSPSITLVFPDSKDSPRTPQGLLKDFMWSPQGVPRDSLYNPHKEGTFLGVPLQSHWDWLRTPSLYLINKE